MWQRVPAQSQVRGSWRALLAPKGLGGQLERPQRTFLADPTLRFGAFCKTLWQVTNDGNNFDIVLAAEHITTQNKEHQ